jgi:hypothetical protein
LAQRYFDQGDPYQTAIASVAQTLDDMTAVRNRIAHRSDFAVRQFHGVVRRSYGYIPRGMSAGRFLLSRNPTALSQPEHFDYYAGILLAASQIVVP